MSEGTNISIRKMRNNSMGGWKALVFCGVCVFAGSACLFPDAAEAVRAVRAEGRPVVVRLALKVTTQIVANDTMVELLTSVDRDQLTIEQIGGRLAMSPLRKTEGDILVRMEGGEIVTVRIETVDRRENADDVVYLTVKAPAAKRERSEAWAEGTADPSDLLRLMVKRIRGYAVTPEALAGVEERETTGAHEEGPLILAKVKRFVAGKYEGLVLRVVNRADRGVSINLPRLAFDGLVAISAEAEELGPVGSGREWTYVYLIREFRS